MEAHCLPGRINISETVAGHVKALFELEPRGSIAAKHERAYEMFFLNCPKQECTCDAVRRLPNKNLFAEYDRMGLRYEGSEWPLVSFMSCSFAPRSS
jgi:hypothetical protein